MKQCILVLGANGFIGGEVVTGLASSGWATPILGVRRPSARSDQFEQRIVEATGVDSVAAAMREVTGVVNCVAGDAQTIVAGTKALFEAAARVTPAPRIMHLSTMSVYGSADGLIDEAATLRGDLGPYSEAKVTAEATASAYPHAVIFRPGCVFGPGSEQWTIRIARLLLAHRLGDLGAAGDGFCNLVHVGDVVAAILRALNEPGADGRAFNLSIPQPPTWNEFLVKYAIALDAVPVRRISQRRLRIEEKLLAPPLKIAEILGRIAKLDARRLPPLIPPSLIRSMRQEIRLDPGRAQAELGLHWKGLEWMLDEGARWFLGSQYAHSHRLRRGN
jgi:nucleoside-diphosphate-sugar epimerase